MIRAIAGVTFRALAGRRRTLLVSLLCALPVLVALLVRVSGRATDLDEVTATVVDRLVISTIVPLVALVFGTSALGSELDDGTAVYLLAKPITRWRIVVAKVFVAAGLAVVVTAPAAFVSAALLGSNTTWLPHALGYAAGTAIAATLYATVFLALSLITSRALAIGLVYVLVWEGILAGLFDGTRTFSIRQYALGVAHAIGGAGTTGGSDRLAGETALGLALAVFGIALLVAIRRLQSFEIGEAD